MTNFKGAKSREISFNGDSVRVIGCNGSGKSTLASAVSWVMSDTDYNLVKNPNVVPLGTPECEIKVEIEFELDGKPLEVAKTQKYKEKTDDAGKVTSSVTNTYSINQIDKPFKDFVVDLSSRGIDIDNFLVYTNPNYFLADTSKSGREKIRKILFEMATDISDREVASEIGANEVIHQMDDKGYSLEEIKASAKGTIRKIKEEDGADNEIINAKIDGMLSSKAVVDTNALEAEKIALQGEIDTIQADIDDIDSSKANIESIIAELKRKKATILKGESDKIKKMGAEFDLELVRLDTDKAKNNSALSLASHEIESLQKQIKSNQESLDNWRDLYKKVQDEVLDEKDLKCPTCGRTLPDNEIEEIKSNFESSKNERLNSYKARGEEAKAEISRFQSEIEEKEKILNELKEKDLELLRKEDSIKEKISVLPFAPTRTVETDAIDRDIEVLEGNLNMADADRLNELNSKLADAKSRLQEIIGQLAVNDRNAEIDKNIELLRAKRKVDEIAKAEAEKILSQVDEVEMTKNSKLAESINKKFDLVEWHLWDRQKNGTLIEVTEPYIDGKPMSSCANGSLVTLAKLSICESLQKARDQRMPIWCDDASLFSKNTVDRINLDTQFVQLIVADNEDLIVEG